MTWDSKIVYDGDDRVEWLGLRRDGIGGSDAAGVLGRSPWSSRVSVFADKVMPPVEEGDEPERVYWGHAREPRIVARYAEKTGRKGRPGGRRQPTCGPSRPTRSGPTSAGLNTRAARARAAPCPTRPLFNQGGGWGLPTPRNELTRCGNTSSSACC